MSTKKKSQPGDAQIKPDDVVYAKFDKSMLIDISSIELCPFQRRTIDPNSPRVKQHILSNAEHGVRTPIKVRPTPQGYENVYGGLRVYASTVNGRKVIPAIVQDLTDEEARIEHAIENLDRADLEPWEEAQTIKDFAALGWDAERIAKALKREPKWTAEKMVLAELEQEWLDEWAKAPRSKGALSVSEFTVSHMVIIARMPAPTRSELLAWFRQETDGYFHVQTVGQLENFIANKFTQQLSAAPFKVDDASLDPKAGACIDCPKRSSCAKLLWADMEDAKAGDRCLDKSCWDRKVAAMVEIKRAEVEAKHGIAPRMISEDYSKHSAPGGKFVSDYAVRPLPKSKGGVPALRADGPNAGTIEYIDPAVKRDPFGAERKEKRTGPRSMKERRDALHRRRVFLRVTNLLDALNNKKSPLATPSLEIVTKLAAVFGTATRSHGPEKKHWTDFDGLKKQAEIAERLWVEVRPVLYDVLMPRGSITDHKLLDASAERVAAIVGWDWEAAWETACAEIPEPKSWATAE